MMKIRVLNEQERFDARNLAREVFFSSGNLGYERDAARSFLEFLEEHTGHLVMIGAYEGDIRGMLAYDPEHWHLSLLFVRKEDQGKGIAAQLFAWLVKEAEKAHAVRITVHAAPGAQAVYEAAGFEPEGDPLTEGGMTVIPMEYLLGKEILGKEVTVTVDRPYGSFHPLYPDLEYPLNYGYVEEVLSGDGEYQDAYIYGPEEPVDRYTGRVIAVIYRRNDNETKWVVTKETAWTRDDIVQAVAFQEQYFDPRFVWLNNPEKKQA